MNLKENRSPNVGLIRDPDLSENLRIKNSISLKSCPDALKKKLSKDLR